MIDTANVVTVLSLVKELRDKGSWAGETHVQKAMFFLDKKCKLSAGFEFVLYKHGPYSFDLHDFLASLFARCMVEHQIIPPYGPRIQLTTAGEEFLAVHSRQIAPVKDTIVSVARWFGGNGVAELEKRATALWVLADAPAESATHLAQQIHEIKPHISVVEALGALETVRAFPTPA